MTALFRIGIAVGFAVCIAGCATPSARRSAAVTSPRTKVISADEMHDAVVIGKSTKADVIAALGETLVIEFDTGFEVWVYRLAGDTHAKPIAHTGSAKEEREAAGEFVILFAPSGIVAKTRIRRAPKRAHEG